MKALCSTISRIIYVTMSVVKYMSILGSVLSTTSDIPSLPIDLRCLIAQFCAVRKCNVSLLEFMKDDLPRCGFYTRSDGSITHFAIPRLTFHNPMVDMWVVDEGGKSVCRFFGWYRCEFIRHIRSEIKLGFGVITIISDSSPLFDA